MRSDECNPLLGWLGAARLAVNMVRRLVLPATLFRPQLSPPNSHRAVHRRKAPTCLRSSQPRIDGAPTSCRCSNWHRVSVGSSSRTFGRLRNARWQEISVQRLRDGTPLGLQAMEHVTHQGESLFDFSSGIAIHCELRDKRSNLSNVAVGIGDLLIYFS